MGKALWEALYTLWGRNGYYPHFIDEATEALTGHTASKWQSQELNPSIPASEATEPCWSAYHVLNTRLM